MKTALAFLLAAIGALAAARAQAPATILSRVEAGLDDAVKWKWKVESSRIPPQGGGSPVPDPAPPESTSPAPQPGEEGTYTVKKGDVLFHIARRHRITLEQLKAANNLKTDRIFPGDVLRIPTPEQIAEMPAPTPRQSATAATADPDPAAADFDPEVLLLQVYLDRMGFSPGPIDGLSGLRFQKLMFTYLSAAGGDAASLVEKARAELPRPFTTYVLRPGDFRWIRIPKPGARSSKKVPPEECSREIYRELTSQPELLYRSAWEFVAERFHCDETFLRKLNPALKSRPEAGSVFRVPNVIPFEIENAFEPPLRPQPDPDNPVKAIIADLSRLEIYQSDTMIASFPVSVARPGLRGRGEWVILDSLPMPRLLTRREPRVERKFSDEDGRETRPAALARDEILGPGPRNPVGLLWINLAKAGEPEPLPYGLHGTSVPGRMYVTESLGGFRLTNWDILRAARLLPVGTPLRWRATIAKKSPSPPGGVPVAPPPALPALPGQPATPAESAAPLEPQPGPRTAGPEPVPFSQP